MSFSVLPSSHALFFNLSYFSLQNHQLWHEGWPLTLSKGELVLHLGSIDESLVRLQDCFLCIQSTAPNVPSKLFACWRKSLDDTIIYRELDSVKRKYSA